MKTRHLPIPKDEQLRALAEGNNAEYRLLSEFFEQLNNITEARRHITVTKAELVEFLQMHPDLAERHVSRECDPKVHEFPVLERFGVNYRVYEVDHNEAKYVKEFSNLPEAAAEYLMWGW